MNTQFLNYSYNEIIFSKEKRNESLIHTWITTWISKHYAKKKNQVKKGYKREQVK